MDFKVNIKPLSVNEAFQGRRFKTKKYKAFEREMMLTIPSNSNTVTTPITLNITFGFSNVLSDIDNPLKATIDVLQKKYKFNDRDVFELNVKKEMVEKGGEFIKVKIN